MILSPAEARLAVGLTGTITDVQRAMLQSLMPKVDAAIARELRYDPQYRVIDDGEWYPRDDLQSPGVGLEVWETTPTFAHLSTGERDAVLQLANIPVRSIEEIRVDYAGGFGQKPNTFGTDKTYSVGVDYWQEFSRPYFNMTGHVYGNAGWPKEPGTILVKYTAGFTKLELRGQADKTVTDPQTNRAGSGFNASGIMDAATLTIIKSFKTLVVQGKQGRVGFVPGVLTSESLGKYSYSAGGGGADYLTAMKVQLPPEAKEALSEFVHYGINL